MGTGNALRAAVSGVNYGRRPRWSLVMGVAGDPGRSVVFLTGAAGAGRFVYGDWVSG